MTYYHPIDDSEIATLARTLIGTDDSLEVAISEMGIDPDEHDLRDVEQRLAQYVVLDEDTNTWIRQREE